MRKHTIVNVVTIKCDICDDKLDCSDDIEDTIDVLEEISDSYLDDHDRLDHITGPRLLLCRYCTKEYQIPSYLDK